MPGHRSAGVRSTAGALLMLLAVAAGCSDSKGDETMTGPPATRPTEPTAAATSPVTVPPTTASPVTASPVTASPVTASPVTAADLGSSWRPGCPVGPDDLRLLTVPYWGFDDQPHVGALVVHADVADGVVAVFAELYEQRFPISRMQPVDAYGGDDDASMAADNTSAFNCRNAVAAGPPRWSQHAYGKAIDVNPIENPYLLGGEVLPPEGAAYLDRADARPGMAVEGGVLTTAFANAGWSWAGHWAAPDYQHFEAPDG